MELVEWLDTRSQSDCLENTMEKKKKIHKECFSNTS